MDEDPNNDEEQDDLQDELQGAAQNTVQATKKAKGLAQAAARAPGMAVRTAGKVMESAGETMQSVGSGMHYLGNRMKKAGRAVFNAGKSTFNAGEQLCAVPFGAILGIPMMLAGILGMGLGKSLEGIGFLLSVIGKAIAKAGKFLKERAKNIIDIGNKMLHAANAATGGGSGASGGESVSGGDDGIQTGAVPSSNTVSSFRRKARIMFFIVIAVIVFIILFVVLARESTKDDGSNNEGDLSNVPYVISSSVMDEIIIVKDSSTGNYTYAFSDENGNLISLDEALDNAIETLRANGSTSLTYTDPSSSSDDVKKNLLKKMIQAEIATQYPDLTGSEDLGYSGQVTEEVNTTVQGCNTNLDVTDSSAFITDLETLKTALGSYNSELESHAEDFLAYQTRYGVNAVFVASICVWETSGGTGGHAVDGCNNWGNIDSTEDPLAEGNYIVDGDHNWAVYPDAETGIQAIFYLIAERGPYVKDGNKTITQVFLKYNSADEDGDGNPDEAGNVASTMASMYSNAGITAIVSNNSTKKTSSGTTKTGDKQIDTAYGTDQTISGGIKIQRKDESGNVSDLKYTSTDNFNALILANDPRAMEYYTLVKTGTGSSGSSTSNFSGSTNAEIIWNFLISKGLSETCAAAVLGNFMQESTTNLDTSLEEVGTGVGYGLAQWSYGRRTQLETYATAMNKSVSDIELQLEFLWLEMDPNADHTYANLQWTGGTSDYERFISCTDVNEATSIFCWQFERPNAYYANLENRQSCANDCYSAYAGKLTTASSSSSSSNSSSETTSSSSSSSDTSSETTSSSSSSSDTSSETTSSSSSSSDTSSIATSTTSSNIPGYQIIVANKTDTTTVVTDSYEYAYSQSVDKSSGARATCDRTTSTPSAQVVGSTTTSNYYSKSFAYQEALQKYTLYFDFLWAVLVDSNNQEMINEWAELVCNNYGSNSKVTITIYNDVNSSSSSTTQGKGNTLRTLYNASSSLAYNDYYNVNETTDITTVTLQSKGCVTYADTWLVNYENNADNYDEYVAKTKEKITEKVDANSSENNIIKILKEHDGTLSVLISEEDLVDEMIAGNAKVSFMVDIYSYILDTANGSTTESLTSVLDVSSFNLTTFVSTSSSSGTSSGSLNGGNISSDGGDGYRTTFTTGSRTFVEYKQGAGAWANVHANGWDSGSTMANSGCALTSIAVIATGYGNNVTPLDVVNLVNSGTYTWGDLVGLLQYYTGKTCSWQVGGNIQQTIIDQLKAGKPCMVHTTYNHPDGHFLTVLAYNEETNEVYISDVGGWYDDDETRNGWRPVSQLSEYDRCMIIGD